MPTAIRASRRCYWFVVGFVLALTIGMSIASPTAWSNVSERAAKEAAEDGFNAREVLGRDVTFIRKGPNRGLFRISLAHGENVITHGPDPEMFADHGEVIGPGDPELKPACADSYATHLIYGRRSVTPNSYTASLPRIRSEIRRITAVLNEAAIDSGGEGARYKVRCGPNGTPSVSQFVNDGSSASCAGNVRSAQCIIDEARQAGFKYPNYPTDNYMIFYDGRAPSDDICGIGDGPVDERLAADNVHRFGELYAITWGGPSQGADDPCWDHRNPMHEIGHNLGAVQYGAPYSSGDGHHCWDGTLLDVMCYDDGGNRIPATGTTERCSGEIHFDCGYNTYFDARPEANEWLSSRWNLGHCLNRFVSFTGVSTCPNPGPKTLIDGAWKIDIHGGYGTSNFYTIQVPTGRTSLVVTLDGPAQVCEGARCSPDYDLYGRLGSLPALNGNPCESLSASADESCTVPNPGAGKWYLEVHNFIEPPEDNIAYAIKADYRP